MKLNEAMGKIQADLYLKQRSFIIDKKKRVLIGLAPEVHLIPTVAKSSAMKWFAGYAGKTITTETLEGLFRKLKDIGSIDLMPMIDWPKAEKVAKATVAVRSEPYKSIEKFARTSS